MFDDFTETDIEVSGARIHLRHGGSGPPLLVLHGDADETIPYAQGRALFAAAPEPKTFFTIRGGHHYEMDAAWSEYWAAWRAFLARLSGGHT